MASHHITWAFQNHPSTTNHHHSCKQYDTTSSPQEYDHYVLYPWQLCIAKFVIDVFLIDFHVIANFTFIINWKCHSASQSKQCHSLTVLYGSKSWSTDIPFTSSLMLSALSWLELPRNKIGQFKKLQLLKIKVGGGGGKHCGVTSWSLRISESLMYSSHSKIICHLLCICTPVIFTTDPWFQGFIISARVFNKVDNPSWLDKTFEISSSCDSLLHLYWCKAGSDQWPVCCWISLSGTIHLPETLRLCHMLLGYGWYI